MLKGWQMAKIISNKKKSPYKQMKDRNMNGVIVYFTTNTIQEKQYYYFKNIDQPNNTITLQYIANLGMAHIRKEYSYKGYGGWISYLTMNTEQFNRMKCEVERLGGKVEVIL